MTLKLVVGWLFIAAVACSLVAIMFAAWQQAREQDRVRALGDEDLRPGDRRLGVREATVTPITVRTLTPAPQMPATRTGTR